MHCCWCPILLIACGFVICRYTPLNGPVWDGAERLVYYVLFPVLLFGSIAKSPLSLASVAGSDSPARPSWRWA